MYRLWYNLSVCFLALLRIHSYLMLIILCGKKTFKLEVMEKISDKANSSFRYVEHQEFEELPDS